MQTTIKYFLTIVLILSAYTGFSQVNLSQSVIASTGSFASTSSNTYSYTAGEVVVATQPSSSLVLTQGFHQPLANGTSTFIQEYADANFSVNVYPNPTPDNISIEITTDKEIDLKIEVIDMLGKVVGKVKQLNPFTGHSTYQCELGEYSSGLYFVKISSKDEAYNKTIRVQKIN